MRGQKGLSTLAIVIVVAVVVAVLVIVAIMFATPRVKEPYLPPVEEKVLPPTEEEEVSPPQRLIPLRDIPREWLEAFPWLEEDYPEGVPFEVIWELEEEFRER